MSTSDQLHNHLFSVEEAPEIFRQALRERHTEEFDLMLYSPACQSGRRYPASILVVTRTGWLALTDDAEGHVTAHRATYTDTLLLEITLILLYGALRIDYLAEGNMRSITVEFNAVHRDDYEHVVYGILGSIGGQAGQYTSRGELDAQLDALPSKFHQAALHNLPLGQRLHSVLHWPASNRSQHFWSSDELAPEAMLLLTDREVILISEVRAHSWLHIGQEASLYGSIVTCLPLVRLGPCRLAAKTQESFSMLELELHAGDQETHPSTVADTVRVGFPTDMTDEVSEFLKLVAAQIPVLGVLGNVAAESEVGLHTTASDRYK